MKKRTTGGFTFLELLLGIFILMVICSLGFASIKTISQKTKVVVAKAYLTQCAMLLETVKDGACYYPPDSNYTLESLTSVSTPEGYGNGWRGPYLKEIPIDPWKKPYFYRLSCGIFWGPERLHREHAKPFYVTFYITAKPGRGSVVMVNESNITHAGSTVWLNGIEIIHSSEFKRGLPKVEKDITLLAQNTLTVLLESNPSAYIDLSLGSAFDPKTTYILSSYGSDNQPGGTGFAKDLTWITKQSGTEF